MFKRILVALKFSPASRSVLEKGIKDRFDTEVKPLLNGFNHVTFGCLPADPALGICKLAKHHNSDLIILGSHQESEKMSLGRVDYVGMTILEKASCPVMLVPS